MLRGQRTLSPTGFGVPEEEKFETKFKKRCEEQYKEYNDTGVSKHGFIDHSKESAYELPEEVAREHVLQHSTPEEYFEASNNIIRRQFIAKVYAIISVQLAVTFAWTVFVMYTSPLTLTLTLTRPLTPLYMTGISPQGLASGP